MLFHSIFVFTSSITNVARTMSACKECKADICLALIDHCRLKKRRPEDINCLSIIKLKSAQPIGITWIGKQRKRDVVCDIY